MLWLGESAVCLRCPLFALLPRAIGRPVVPQANGQLCSCLGPCLGQWGVRTSGAECAERAGSGVGSPGPATVAQRGKGPREFSLQGTRGGAPGCLRVSVSVQSQGSFPSQRVKAQGMCWLRAGHTGVLACGPCCERMGIRRTGRAAASRLKEGVREHPTCSFSFQPPPWPTPTPPQASVDLPD